MTPWKLLGLRPQAYEHPSDAAALDALMHTGGLETLVRKLNAWGFEPFLRVQLTGSYLRATADRFPDLHELLLAACERLDLPHVPELYLASLPGINALTAGVERPLVVLHSAAVELLTPDELLFVIAHEVGHIKSGHVLYYQIAEFLPVIMEIVGAATLGLGDLLSVGVRIALTHWKRMSEFTADRAGLLACQDAETAFRAMMKLAGLPQKYFHAINTEDFLNQARELRAMDADTATRLAKWLSAVGATHPWMVMRAQQLLDWMDGGGYEEVLRAPRQVPLALPAGLKGFCDQCGWALWGAETFCPGCGRPVVPPR
jgi:Zn-dependent protease with chaperone function